MNDPREDITHPIEVGQIYADDRTGEELQLRYMDRSAVLLRSQVDETHRLSKRVMFEKEVGAGRYKLQGEEEVDADFVAPDDYETVDFEEIDGVGSVAASGLVNAGYTTKGDIRGTADSELLDVRGIGEGNLANIRDEIDNT